jgi:hypothetical protein
VMAVYNNDATVEAAAGQSNLSVSFIRDIIAQARNMNLKEEPNKFMQVTRFVHAWFAVNTKRRMYTDHEYKEGLLAWMTGDMDHKQVLQTYGVEQRTLNSGRKRLRLKHSIQPERKKVTWSGWPSKQALCDAVQTIDMSGTRPGPKSAFRPVEAALIVHRWDLLSGIGEGLASNGQINDLQGLCTDLAANLKEQVELSAIGGRVDPEMERAAKKLRSPAAHYIDITWKNYITSFCHKMHSCYQYKCILVIPVQDVTKLYQYKCILVTSCTCCLVKSKLLQITSDA